MKFEFEISDDDVKAAIEKRISAAIHESLNGWVLREHIAAQIKSTLTGAADAMVAKVLEGHDEMRSIIIEEVQRKLRAQIAAAMKVTK